MADGQFHPRLLAFAVGIDGLRGESAPVPDTDLSPCCVNCAGERVCGIHVLHMPAEPLADGPDGLSFLVVHADRAECLAPGRIHHLPRQGAGGILFLGCVDAYRRHGTCQMMADETIVVVVVDNLNLRADDVIWGRIAGLADTLGAACI